MPYAHITGWGMYLPEKVLTNDDLAKIVETSDEWIRTRTGIRERRLAAEHETPATMGAQAALQALSVANLRPDDIDLIICTSSSTSHIFPAIASLIQDQIGASRAGAFDLLAACSGFIYAMNMAALSIRSGAIRNALVVGTETLSRYVNWQDRSTCILFGDGAGAFVLQACERPGGVLAAVMHSDGSGGDLLTLPVMGEKFSENGAGFRVGQIYMDGREVFRFATRVMVSATEEVLKASGLSKEEIRLIIPHQANYRIIEAAARGLKIPLDRFVINLERFGNTSTASIPIATVEAVQSGRLKPGDPVVFVGFGAGLTWGALAAIWTGPLPVARKIVVKRYRLWGRLRSLLRRLQRYLEGILWGRKMMS